MLARLLCELETSKSSVGGAEHVSRELSPQQHIWPVVYTKVGFASSTVCLTLLIFSTLVIVAFL